MKKPYAKKPCRLPCYDCGKILQQDLDDLDLCKDCAIEFLALRVDQARSSLTDYLICSIDSNATTVAQLRACLLETSKDLAFAKGKLEGLNQNIN